MAKSAKKFERVAFVASDVPEARHALERLAKRYGNAEPGNAEAIVAHREPRDATAGNLDVDARRLRVERILEQLFDRARRPLDHLAGCDLARQLRRQDGDARRLHAARLYQAGALGGFGHAAALPNVGL